MPPHIRRIVIQLDPALTQSIKNIEQSLHNIEQSLVVFAKDQEEIMADLSALQSEVQSNTDAVQSAVALINGLADQLQNATTPEEVQSIVEQLRSNTQSLADAVVANTPASGSADQGSTEAPSG